MAINLEKALQIMTRARLASEKMGVLMSFAIFNDKHDLILFMRMDGSSGESVRLAQLKALTCLKLCENTDNLAYLVNKENGVLRGIRYDNAISLIGGGKLICDNGTIIGAIGVSGGSETQDIEVAAAALVS